MSVAETHCSGLKECLSYATRAAYLVFLQTVFSHFSPYVAQVTVTHVHTPYDSLKHGSCLGNLAVSTARNRRALWYVCLFSSRDSFDYVHLGFLGSFFSVLWDKSRQFSHSPMFSPVRKRSKKSIHPITGQSVTLRLSTCTAFFPQEKEFAYHITAYRNHHSVLLWSLWYS